MISFFSKKSLFYCLAAGFFIIIFFPVFFTSPLFGASYCIPGTDSDRCNAKLPNWVQKCGNCDADAFNEWCNTVNCAASGQTCLNGACQSAACVESWTCEAWSACVGGKQTRACTDANACGTTGSKPATEQICMALSITSPAAGETFNKTSISFFQTSIIGGTPPYTYQWSSTPGGVFSSKESENIFFNNPAWIAGDYNITAQVTDSLSVMATDSVQITVKPGADLIVNISSGMGASSLLEVSRSDRLSLLASAQGGSSPYAYEWTSDQAAGVLSTSQALSLLINTWTLGNYRITVKVKDAKGAEAYNSIDIKVVEMAVYLPQPFDGDHNEQGYNMYFYGKVTGGAPPYNFKFVSDRDGQLAVDNSSNNFSYFMRDNLSLGIHKITLTVADSNGLESVISKWVQIDPLTPILVDIISPNNNAVYTMGDDISYKATAKFGVQPINSYQWQSSIVSGIFGDSDEFIKNNLAAGSHIITVTATDSKGNIGTKTINLTIQPPAPLNAQIISPADGGTFLRLDNMVTMEAGATGGVKPYSYSWSSNKDGPLGSGNIIFKNDLSVNNHIITLTVTDNNASVSAKTVNLNINQSCTASANVKNLSKYSARESFLISDSSSNWRNILSLVPVTTWKDGATINAYPSLIYHDEGTNFDMDSIIHFFQLYEPTHLVTIGPEPNAAVVTNLLVAAKTTGAGLNPANIANINPADYFSYWTSFNSLVAVDYNNYKAGLMAAVLASRLNSPIIFVNSANLAGYGSVISGKTVYTVGALDSDTQNYINANAACQVSHTLESLQKWYAAAVNSDKMILVNPDDLTIKLNYAYATQKSGTINSLYSKMSLAAPFLAAARQEVIAYTVLTDPGTNGGCSASANISARLVQADNDAAWAINNLFPIKPQYLTIIASPQSIPDSKYYDCHDSWQFREPWDVRFGSLNNDYGSIKANPELRVGRIHGVTVADTSSYIARDLNYDYLLAKIYSGQFYAFSVAHDFTSTCDYAQLVKNKTQASGYSSACSTGTLRTGCAQAVKPPFASYQKINYITYGDHGSPYSWWQTLEYSEIPWLDVPVVFNSACLTNDYWQSGSQKNFGAHMIRRGAIVYVGATGVSWSSSDNNVTEAIKLLGSNNDLTLGELKQQLDKNVFNYIDYYSLFGDPVLKPKFKAVAW